MILYVFLCVGGPTSRVIWCEVVRVIFRCFTICCCFCCCFFIVTAVPVVAVVAAVAIVVVVVAVGTIAVAIVVDFIVVASYLLIAIPLVVFADFVFAKVAAFP